jgi:hypothetical protein
LGFQSQEDKQDTVMKTWTGLRFPLVAGAGSKQPPATTADRLSVRGSNPKTRPLRSYDGPSCEFISVAGKNSLTNAGLLSCREIHDAEDARVGFAVDHRKFSEILVQGD